MAVGNLLSSTSKSSSSSKSGKSWHSVTGYFGPVDEITQANKDKYGQEWQQSERVVDAYNKMQEAQQNRPQFNSTYKGQVEDIYNKINNREQFNYNFNADKLYQQYAEQYRKIGRKGMQDTIAEAAKLAGGYGNTYAKTAGQQQYQKYLSDINNVLPELYEKAYQKYSDETNNLYKQYGIASDLYNTEYGEYRDKVGDWKSDRQFATDMYRNERNFDYGKWTDSRKFWQDEYWNQRKAVKESWGEEESWGETEGTETNTKMYEDLPDISSSSKSSSRRRTSSKTRDNDPPKEYKGTYWSETDQGPSALGDYFTDWRNKEKGISAKQSYKDLDNAIGLASGKDTGFKDTSAARAQSLDARKDMVEFLMEKTDNGEMSEGDYLNFVNKWGLHDALKAIEEEEKKRR